MTFTLFLPSLKSSVPLCSHLTLIWSGQFSSISTCRILCKTNHPASSPPQRALLGLALRQSASLLSFSLTHPPRLEQLRRGLTSSANPTSHNFRYTGLPTPIPHNTSTSDYAKPRLHRFAILFLLLTTPTTHHSTNFFLHLPDSCISPVNHIIPSNIYGNLILFYLRIPPMPSLMFTRATHYCSTVSAGGHLPRY